MLYKNCSNEQSFINGLNKPFVRLFFNVIAVLIESYITKLIRAEQKCAKYDYI